MRPNSLSATFDSAPESPPFSTKPLSFRAPKPLQFFTRHPRNPEPSTSSSSSIQILESPISPCRTSQEENRPNFHACGKVWLAKRAPRDSSGYAVNCRLPYTLRHMQYTRGRVLLSDAAPILSLTATDRRPSAQTAAVPQRPPFAVSICRNPRSYPSGTKAHRSPRSASAQTRSRPEI
jgi:hypothetical protein